MAKRILIVDDEPDVRDAWGRTLSDSGYSVEVAADGKAALKLCRDHAFDLVIVDFILGGMSGLELLNQIRDRQPTIRSIVISGKVDPGLTEDEVAARLKVELETDAYFQKPLRSERLLETVSGLFEATKEQDWKTVASRVLNSKKKVTRVRKTEQSLKDKKRRP